MITATKSLRAHRKRDYLEFFNLRDAKDLSQAESEGELVSNKTTVQLFLRVQWERDKSYKLILDFKKWNCKE